MIRVDSHYFFNSQEFAPLAVDAGLESCGLSGKCTLSRTYGVGSSFDTI